MTDIFTSRPMTQAAYPEVAGPPLHEVVDHHALASLVLATGSIVRSTLLDPFGPAIVKSSPVAAAAWNRRDEFAEYAVSAYKSLSDLPRAESMIATVRASAVTDTDLTPRDIKSHFRTAQRALPIAQTMLRHTTEAKRPVLQALVTRVGRLGAVARIGAKILGYGPEELATMANQQRPLVREKLEWAHAHAVLPFAAGLDRFFQETSKFENPQAELIHEARAFTDVIWDAADAKASDGKATSKDVGYALYETLRNLQEDSRWTQWAETSLPMLSKLVLSKIKLPEYVPLLPEALGISGFALKGLGIKHRPSADGGKIDVATPELIGAAAEDIMRTLETLGTPAHQRHISARAEERIERLRLKRHTLRKIAEDVVPRNRWTEALKLKLEGLPNLSVAAEGLRDLMPTSQQQGKNLVSALARLTIPATRTAT